VAIGIRHAQGQIADGAARLNLQCVVDRIGIIPELSDVAVTGKSRAGQIRGRAAGRDTKINRRLAGNGYPFTMGFPPPEGQTVLIAGPPATKLVEVMIGSPAV